MTRKSSVSHQHLLTPDEVVAVLRMVKSLTAQTAMALIYLCELSAKTVVKVMASDIRQVHSNQRVVRISTDKATGEEVSWVLLPRPAWDLVDWCLEKNNSDWLFPDGGTHISVRSLKIAFELALAESGIQKKSSFETLLRSAELARPEAPRVGLHDMFNATKAASLVEVRWLLSDRVCCAPELVE